MGIDTDAVCVCMVEQYVNVWMVLFGMASVTGVQFTFVSYCIQVVLKRVT